MIVRNIIDTKAIREIVTIRPTDTVRTAVELLAKHRIGAVIVSGNGSIVDGILSERDIVRTLAKEGPGCLNGPASRLMTAKVVTCTPAHSIAEVMEIMTNSRIRHLPVMEGERLAGMVSIGDVVKWRLEEAQEEVRQMAAYVAGAA